MMFIGFRCILVRRYRNSAHAAAMNTAEDDYSDEHSSDSEPEEDSAAGTGSMKAAKTQKKGKSTTKKNQ